MWRVGVSARAKGSQFALRTLGQWIGLPGARESSLSPNPKSSPGFAWSFGLYIYSLKMGSCVVLIAGFSLQTVLLCLSCLHFLGAVASKISFGHLSIVATWRWPSREAFTDSQAAPRLEGFNPRL